MKKTNIQYSKNIITFIVVGLIFTSLVGCSLDQQKAEVKQDKPHIGSDQKAHQKDNPTERSYKYEPEEGYASTTNAEYVEPSADTKLKPGQQIKDLTSRNYNGEVITQRLTDKTFWIQIGFYNTLVYVGNNEVLVVDPLGYGSGPVIIETIKKLTDKPITAVVYSHQHEDHIGEIGAFIQNAKADGRELRIIASDKTQAVMQQNGTTLPLATDVIAFDGGTTKFEDLTLKVRGFEPAAHVEDSSAWLLVEEKIIHAPDMFNPDQMPYLNFGGSETYDQYENNLAAIGAEDWQFFSGGHGNIGSRKDLAFMQQYIKDLETAVHAAVKKYETTNFFSAEFKNHHASAHASAQYVINDAVNTLRPKYGTFYGFEASAPYQVKMVHQHFVGE